MVSRSTPQPQNLPELLVWYTILGTYAIYYLGAQFVVTPLLASFLVFYLIKQWWHQPRAALSTEPVRISVSAWVWIVAVLIIEVALIIGHANFDLEISQIIKSSSYWYRRWALLALFPLVGHLPIRPQLIYRAVCILCLQIIVFAVISAAAGVLNLPNFSFVSPLAKLGGEPLHYQVYLFGYIHDVEELRLQLFTPWPPALGLMGNLYLCLACQEANLKWRTVGIVGAVMMIIGSVSRMALIASPTVFCLVWLLTNFMRPWVPFLAAFLSFILGLFASPVIQTLQDVKTSFTRLRSGSSRTRAALQNMAISRWWNEAPIWGHGMNDEQGPAVVGHMPIGSHHTWFGLLFAHGIVGCLALALAFVWSLLNTLIKAQFIPVSRVALTLLLILLLFSFGENIDTLAYLFWPALVIIGVSFKVPIPFDQLFLRVENRPKTKMLTHLH